MFDSLLDESHFVKKKTAQAKAEGRVEGRVEGRMEGRAEGEIETLRQVIVEIVQTHFPALAQLAQQKVTTLSESRQFHGLAMQIALSRDEKAARDVLSR